MKTGQTVVCIKSHPSGFTIKGDEYVIKSVYQCGCGNKAIDVGVVVPLSNGSICKCGSKMADIWYQSIERFRLVEYNSHFKSNSISIGLARKALESVEIVETEEIETLN